MNKKTVYIISFAVFLLVLALSGFSYQNKIAGIAEEAASKPISEPIEKEKVQMNPEKIFVHGFNNTIDIYIKGSEPESDKYIGYRLTRTAKPKDSEVFSSNYDVWSISDASEYKRLSESRFRFTRKVVAPGAWEMAIKEVDSEDFVGGTLHGDEFLSDVKFLLDGKEVDFSEPIKQEAETLELETTSNFFRDTSVEEEDVKIGESSKNYAFNKEGLVIDQEVRFTENLTLDKSYLAMLPTLRKSDGATGSQVTDKIVIGNSGEAYDVSEERFNIPELRNVQTDSVKLTGEESGISAEVSVLEKSPDTLPSIFHISDSPSYNKLYFGFNPDGYNVEENDVWNQKTQFKIDTSN